MCDKEVGELQENLQPHPKRMPKVVVQWAEEIFPTLKKNMVSILYMLRIKSSCSLMIGFAGVFDVPRQNT
jgi:hypothetical protein